MKTLESLKEEGYMYDLRDHAWKKPYIKPNPPKTTKDNTIIIDYLKLITD